MSETKRLYHANRDLAQRKGISDEQLATINDVGNLLMQVCKRPLMFGNYKEVVRIVESLETTLQMLWGFSYNPKYHYYQFEIIGCVCPQQDNLERIGDTDTRIVNGNCPFHGYVEDE